MTDLEFEQEVMSYSGMYPQKELKKFYNYYTKKKHFAKQGRKFNLKARLNNWFDKEKGKKRLDKYKDKQNKSKVDTDLQHFCNLLGFKARIIK